MSETFNPREIREERARLAVAEARRFISRAEAFITSKASCYGPSRETAAMKRASMDLTRSLAALRRSPFTKDES